MAPRFEGLGWNTVTVEDANDVAASSAALAAVPADDDRPTLIIVKSIIGYGAPNKANFGSPRRTAGREGSAPDQGGLRLAGRREVPRAERSAWSILPDGVGRRGRALQQAWQSQFERYASAHPRAGGGAQPRCGPASCPRVGSRDSHVRGRRERDGHARRSGKVLNQVATHIPWLIGGSADLAPSNMTLLKSHGAGHFQAGSYAGRNLHFGIREHAMAAVCNGMALSGLRPYGGTFFVFTDYMRPSMRLASLMRQGVIYVLTHDSIGLGEDGPTHQPVEHLAACRAIPRLLVFRPADANEVAESYRAALEPSASAGGAGPHAAECPHARPLAMCARPPAWRVAATCCSIRPRARRRSS